MFKRPIVGVGICMACGIFVGYGVEIPLKIAFSGFFVFAIASLAAWVLEKRVEKGVTFIFIYAAMFSLGITLLQGERQSLLTQARALGIGLSESQGTIDAKKGSSDSGWRTSEYTRKFQYLSVHGIICAFPEERSVSPAKPGREEEDEIDAASEMDAISDNAPESSAGIYNRMKKVSFPLKIEEVRKKDKWKKMDGKIQVNVYEADEIASPTARSGLAMTKGDDSDNTERKFRIGDRIEINGQLRLLPGPRNPGDFDYGAYLLRKGIVGQMSVRVKGKVGVAPERDRADVLRGKSGAGLTSEQGRGTSARRKGKGKNGGCPYFILSRGNIGFIKRIAAAGRDYMEKIIDLGPYDGGREALLKAMLIGKREGLDEGMKENFINTGTVHIMAISGLHLIIVMAIILFICKISFLPERFSSILCIAFLVIYAFLTGGRASIWRATIMAGIFLGGKFFFRQVDKWTSLSLAGLIIVSISPHALFDSGFQLTFMTVAGLMYLYPRLENLLRRKASVLFTKFLSRYLVKAFLVVLVAQLALGPFLIYYYYRFPLVVFVANLAVVPLLGIITTIGFVSSLVGFFSLPLARAFNAVNNIFLFVMERTAAFLGGLPGQIIYLPRIDPIFFLFYYIILFLIFHPLKASHN